MKTIIKTTFFAALISYSAAIFGQQQEAGFYKQMVEECLSKGDCNKAQIMYDGYKNAIGKADVNIESRIKACIENEEEQIWITATQKNTPQAYRDYVSAYPRGKYVTDASNNIARLERLQALQEETNKQNSKKSNSETRVIEGTVVDKTGEPVIGASISLKEDNTGAIFSIAALALGSINDIKSNVIGTVTDINGYFSLDCPAQKEYTLTVKYRGYKTQNIHVNANTVGLKIIMK